MTKRKTQSNVVGLRSARDETPDFELEKAVPATCGLAEAALVLGIHKSTAWALCQVGEFPVPVLRVGTRIRVVKIHLQEFLETGVPVTFESASAKPVAFEPLSPASNG